MFVGLRRDELREHVVAGVRLLAPIDAERLHDDLGRPPGERRLAYWARVWPGSVVLAELVRDELAPRLAGKRVIELGCGLGAVGIAAARAGADVVVTDREADAVAFAEGNARENGVTVRGERLVWERVPDAMSAGFDLVLGAEIVYDREQVAPLAGAIAELLAPGGEAWISDPERLGSSTLVEACAGAGLVVSGSRTLPHPDGVPTADGAEAREVHVYRFVRAATLRP